MSDDMMTYILDESAQVVLVLGELPLDFDIGLAQLVWEQSLQAKKVKWLLIVVIYWVKGRDLPASLRSWPFYGWRYRMTYCLAGSHGER